MVERKPIDLPANRELLEGLLTLPGSVGESYNRLRRYSPRNIGFLALQGCPPEPIATFKKWQELGGHVKKGSKAFAILRPIMIRKKDEEGEPTDEMFRRFKVVRAIFPLSMTSGAELPPYEPPHWSKERALGALGVREVAFQEYDGNVGGYAVGNEIAINPIAPHPLRTLMHELSHVQHGHTTPENALFYEMHRGEYEFQAEASAHVVLNELGELDEETAKISRGYVQGWMGKKKPTEQSLRKVLNVATEILNAGYEPEEKDQ